MIPVHKRYKFKSEAERLFAQEAELMKRAGEINDWRYEEWKFNLGEGLWYTPDFVLVHKTHFQVVEIKGYSKNLRDGISRFKTAIKMFPWFQWTMKRLVKGNWETMYDC